MQIKNIIEQAFLDSMTPEQEKAILDNITSSIVKAEQEKEEVLDSSVEIVLDSLKKVEANMIARLNLEAKNIQKGKDGKNGPQGEKGERGNDGLNGLNGKDGKDGVDGKDGQDGISIVDVRVALDNHIVVTLSNGEEIDAGFISSENGANVYATLKQTADTGSLYASITDLQTQITALSSSLSTVATTGSYDDLSNKPTIPSNLTVKDEGTTLSSAVTSIDFTGAGVTATNVGGAVSVAISGGGGGISSADIQEFTSAGSSTWTKPAGAKFVYILAYGGGGGGGSGRRRAVASLATACSGGGGGAAGGRIELFIPATQLGATETVTVGAGGTGGAAIATDDSSGNGGTNGGNSLVGSWLIARGGTGGNGGTTTSGTAGTGCVAAAIMYTGSTIYTSSGGAGGTSSSSPGNKGGYSGGGGAGSPGFAANGTTENVGLAGGKGGAAFTTSTTGTSGGGAFGNAHGNGGNGSNSTTYFVGGDGGGSGGSGNLVAAGAGGNGGYPSGAGGGGGGAHGANSGAGGNGGNGYVRIVTFF